MSTLRLHNTLTRKKEDFVPLDPKNVRMYVCGPTVYDFAHIGNARPVIVFDVLFRVLRHIYGEQHVTYVRNITDVDDKINARAQEIAKERGIPVMDAIREITAKTAKQYEDDVMALGCLKPTFEPRATDHIKQMIVLIEKLIAAKHAYVAEGHVLYDVSSKPDYGKLSRRSLDEMIAGARVEVAPYKKNPMDFVLWKPSPPELPGWESPWGRGRPGWHIECSAMAEEYLGETFDIHGGGIDLLFPHHENEIAQSEGAHPRSHFARVWLHNGFLQMEGEKMSKSLGNFVTIRDLRSGWRGEPWAGLALRLAMLGVHYRQPMDWTYERLSEAKYDLLRFVRLRKGMKEVFGEDHADLIGTASDGVLSVLDDDINTPEALTLMRTQRSSIFAAEATSTFAKNEYPKLVSNLHLLGLFDEHALNALEFDASKGMGPVQAADVASAVQEANALPVLIANNDMDAANAIVQQLHQRNFYVRMFPNGTIEQIQGTPLPLSVQSLVDARNAAKRARNFEEADRIRDELEAKGIILKDNSDGTTNWEVKR